MNQAQLPYVLLYLCSTFLSSVSQVLLKKAALRELVGDDQGNALYSQLGKD